MQFTLMEVPGILKPATFYIKAQSAFSFREKLIERVIQYFKDRTESFDDYYPCTKNKNCDLEHVYNWIKLFVYLYNAKIRNNIVFNIGGEVVLS
jgi:hypothetical protein